MSEGFGNFQNLFGQIQQMQQQFAQMKEGLKEKEVQASSGGGMVTVTVCGDLSVKRVQIDPTVINADDPEMLQDLVQAAVNEALRKAKDLFKDEMAQLTGGLPIPGFGV